MKGEDITWMGVLQGNGTGGKAYKGMRRAGKGRAFYDCMRREMGRGCEGLL